MDLVSLFSPSRLGRFPGCFGTLLCGHSPGASAPTFQAATPSQFDGGRILVGWRWRWLLRITGRKIDHALCPLVQVTRALWVLLWHGASMRRDSSRCQRTKSVCLNLLVHYQKWSHVAKAANIKVE
jgi:hypothetical protein